MYVAWVVTTPFFAVIWTQQPKRRHSNSCVGQTLTFESALRAGLRGRFTIVMIKLAKQVFLCANGVTSISAGVKNLRLHFSQPDMAGTLPSYLRTTKLRSAMPRTVCHKPRVVRL